MTKNHHKPHHFLSVLQDAFLQQVFPTPYSSTLLKVPQNKQTNKKLKNQSDKKNQKKKTPHHKQHAQLSLKRQEPVTSATIPGQYND